MSEQKSRLSIEIDSSQAVRDAQAVTKELIAIKTTGDFAAKSVEGTSKSINHFSQEGAKGASSAKTLSDQVKSVGNSSKIASDGISKVTQSTAASAASMDSAAKAARALASRIAAIATVGAAVSKMDAYSNLQNRLRLVTTSQEELNKATSDTFNIAQKTRQEWDAVAQVYQRFSDNAKLLGLSMDNVAALTSTVAKATAMSGASTQAADAALTQFGQALASGVLRGEELNSVMEQTPALAKAIAEGMGITIGQLRAVAAEGKITSEEMTKALTSVAARVDEDYAKIAPTIGQAMTQLGNATTKFAGEAGAASGAASGLSTAISLLANNLEAVSGVVMLGGIAYLTKTILTHTVATYGSITALVAKRAALIAEQQEAVKSATVAVSLARANLANVQALNAETAAMRGQNVAARELAASKGALAAAESTLGSAQGTLSKSTSLLSRGFNLIGGPIGAIAIAVTGLSALYSHFKAKTEEANQKLAEQALVANKTAEELRKLEGVERAAAKTDLADSFLDQNMKLLDLNDQFNKLVGSLSNVHGTSAEYIDIAAKVERGMISQEEALERLSRLEYLTPDQRKQAIEIINNYEVAREKAQKNADAQKTLGNEVRLAGNESANSVGKNFDLANSHYRVAEGADVETKSLSELRKERLKLAQQSTDDIVKANDLWLRSAKANKDGGAYGDFMKDFKTRYKLPISEALPKEFEAIAHKEWLSTKEIAGYREQITKQAQAQAQADREKTKELEKQNKLLANGARLVGISGNTGKSSGPHLHVQYPMGSNKGGVTKEHLARFQLGGKTLNPNNSNSPYGKVRSDGKKHGGWDFETPVGTPITTNVAVKNVTTHKGDNAGFYSRVTFADGVVIDLMHQVPGIDQKLKGGASDGKSNSLTYKQQESLELKDARESESLSNDYRTITEKDAADHQKRMTDLRKHGLTKEMEMEKARYEKTKELRALEQTLEIDGWRWVGEEKIKNDAAVNRLRIEASTDLGKTEKEQAIESNKELMNYELSAYRRLQQEKMKEFRATIEQQTAEYQRMYYDALAKASMIQPAYARWDAQNSYGDQVGAAWDNKQSAIDKADEKDSKTDQYLNDANTRYQMYLDAEKNYQAQLLLIKQKGLLDEKAMRDQQYTDNLSVYGSMFGGMAELVKGYAGEASGTYKTLFFMQKSFALAQAGMNVYKAASDAYANEPGTIWQKIGAATLATVQSGALLSLIQASTPQGFATGGYISGKGTGTSDDIPIMASNGEFMIREFAASKLGLQTLKYINKTGELPYQEFQEQLLLEQGNSKASVQRFSTGGLVGSPQQSSPMIERQRLIAVRENSTTLNQPSVTIINQTSQPVEAETDWNDGKLQVILTEMRKQNEAVMDAKIQKNNIMSKRQGW